MRLLRVVPALLFLVLLFSFATPSAAEPSKPRLDLAGRAWDLIAQLVHLSLPDGCAIDPDGRCRTPAAIPPDSNVWRRPSAQARSLDRSRR